MKFQSFLKTVLCLLGLSSLVVAWILLISFSHPVIQKTIQTNKRSLYVCPDVLKHMTSGNWVSQETSRFTKLEMDVFLEKARKDFYIPGTLQRLDNKCGNVTFDWLVGTQQPLLWFRALCDPKGDNPCCYNNMCTKRTEEQCRCPNCLDMRQQINAEHALWMPRHGDCQIPTRNPESICKIIKNMTIYFIGDSFIRHLYTAFLMLVRGNLYNGALATRPSIPSLIHSKCIGMYVFSDPACRAWLEFNTTLCHNTTSVQFLELPKAEHLNTVTQNLRKLQNKPNTMVFFGIGIHNEYDTSTITNQFLDPILRQRKLTNQKWPRLLWHSAHAPGLLKTPRIPAQSYKSVQIFNAKIKDFLKEGKVPVFESFKLTDGVNSFDGAHYGQGVNLIKAQIFVEFIKQLRLKEKW